MERRNSRIKINLTSLPDRMWLHPTPFSHRESANQKGSVAYEFLAKREPIEAASLDEVTGGTAA